MKRASRRKRQRHSLITVHAQKGVAHRVSVEVADPQGVRARYDITNKERQSTRIVAHVPHLESTGARRAAQNKGAAGEQVDVGFRFIRHTGSRCRPRAYLCNCRRCRSRGLTEDLLAESH